MIERSRVAVGAFSHDALTFGTARIRGADQQPDHPADMALRFGQAAGLAFRRGDHQDRVVIGKDTRLSGYMIEYAVVAGFTSIGLDVLLLGPVPTPAGARLTRSMRFHLGSAGSTLPTLGPFRRRLSATRSLGSTSRYSLLRLEVAKPRRCRILEASQGWPYDRRSSQST